MSNFIVTFPLKTEKYQEDVLNKRFEIGRNIYNGLVNVTQKRHKEMIKTKEYRNLLSSLSGKEKNDKTIWKEINALRRKYNFSEYDFHKDVVSMQHHFSKNIDAQTAQKIASRLWVSYDKFFFGNGHKVYYKKYGEINSLEGKSNSSGIKIRGDKLVWNGLSIPIEIDYSNPYEYQAMQNKICYSRVIRRYIRSKYKYYVQIIFKGTPPIKFDKETGELKHPIGAGDVGLDIGTSTIAISSSKDVKLFELADKVKNMEREKKLILRKMDRSRRATNPNNYNEDGTYKEKVRFKKSNHYKKLQLELQEIISKQARVRKQQHEILANYIISLGDKFYVEDMNFKGLQKRALKTEKNDKGKYKRKRRFGKSLGNRAPAMLIEIINRKLKYWDKELVKINTYKTKASQFNHFDETYTKKKLSERWNDFNGVKVQRDLYSAFLIMNVADDLENFDMKKCNDRFDLFYAMHNLEVERLKGNKNLSCMGI